MSGPNTHVRNFVFVTILIDAMSFGLIMPVLPRMLMRVGGIDLSGSIEIATWIGLLMAAAAFFSAPVLGNLSDSLGRRKVLLFSLAGMAAHYAVLAVAGSITMIVVGRVLTGVFGGSYAPAQAAIADVTGDEDRAKNFAFVSAGFGVGFVFGPALGGLLVEFGERAPFWVALALSAVNLVYGFFAFPETLKPELRRPFSLARANPFGAWKIAGEVFGMRRLALVLLLWQLASLVYPLTWSFWGIAALGWSDRMIGLSLAAVGIVIAASQILMTGRVVRRLGERGAAQVGMVGAALGYIGYALASTTWFAFALLIAVAIQSLVQPSLMAMLSRRATPETQGEVQGLAAMMMGVGSIIGPLVLAWPMAWFTSPAAPFQFPGVAFAISAVITLAALLLLRTTQPMGSAAPVRAESPLSLRRTAMHDPPAQEGTMHNQTANARRFAILGAVLVMIGLLTGFVSGQLDNPRMGLASHLEALMNGTLLLALAAVWPHVRLSPRGDRWAFGLLAFGSLANWLATFLAAAWGAGAETMPLTAAGQSAAAWQEAIVTGLLVVLSFAMVAGIALVLIGLLKGRDQPS